MKKYVKRENACLMFNRYFHNLEGNEAQTLVCDMRQAFLELPAFDVAPREEVAIEIFEEIEKKLCMMLPAKVLTLFNGEKVGNSFDLGKERALYDALICINELRKTYTEGYKRETALWVKSKGEPPWAYHCNKCGYSKEPGKMFPNFCPNCHSPMLRREEW